VIVPFTIVLEDDASPEEVEEFTVSWLIQA